MAGVGGKYKAYPEYKDSGIEWLGAIPEHWEVKPLKYFCSYNDDVLSELLAPDFELEYVDIGSVSATDGIKQTEVMSFSKSPSRARRKVKDGDVIVSTVRTYLEAIAPIVDPPENLVVSTGFAVIRPTTGVHKKYAAYLLRAKGFIKEVVARSVGVSYPAINASELVGIKTVLPKEAGQATITRELEILRSQGKLNEEMVLKDPYVLDFLEMNDSYLEKDLEDAILREMQQFLLELDKSGIHVADYLTNLPAKAVLEERFQQAIHNARQRIENKSE